MLIDEAGTGSYCQTEMRTAGMIREVDEGGRWGEELVRPRLRCLGWDAHAMLTDTLPLCCLHRADRRLHQ